MKSKKANKSNPQPTHFIIQLNSLFRQINESLYTIWTSLTFISCQKEYFLQKYSLFFLLKQRKIQLGKNKWTFLVLKTDSLTRWVTTVYTIYCSYSSFRWISLYMQSFSNTCEKIESAELWFFSLKTSFESLDCLIAFSTHPTIPTLFSVSAPSLVVAFLIARLNEFFLFPSYWNKLEVILILKN